MTSGNRTIRRVVVALVVFAALVCINAVLTWALVPWGGQTQVVRSEWRAAADEHIDTIVVGSSFAQHDVDPGIFDSTSELESSTFNLATPWQSRHSTIATVEDAVETHQVSRVILMAAVGNLASDSVIDYDVVFALSEASAQPLPQAIATYLGTVTDSDFVGTADSVAALAPWIVDHVGFTPASIKGNIRNRMECERPLEAYGRVDWRPYMGRGYFQYNDVLYVDTVSAECGPPTTDELTVRDSAVSQYEEVLARCEELGVKLYFVVPPRPAYSTLRFGENYGSMMSIFRDMCERHGATLLDFTMVRPGEVADPGLQTTDFSDFGHLNYSGAQKFSPTLARLIARIEQQGSVEDLFFSYEDWDDYLASIDYLSVSTFAAEPVDGGLHLSATSYTGSNVRPEYRFERRLADGSLEEIRGWSEDAELDLALEGHGTITLRMEARQVGAAEVERVCEKTVLY